VTIHTPRGDLSQTIEHREESDWVTEPLFKNTDDLNKFYSFPYEPYDVKSICLDEYIYWKNVIKEQGLVVFETYCIFWSSPDTHSGFKRTVILEIIGHLFWKIADTQSGF